MKRRDFLEGVGGAVAGAALLAGTASASGSFTDESYAGYGYRRYTPSDGASGSPLVVMLHGCTQEPDDFAAATRMNDVAEREGFVAVYPNQNDFANWADCWNWYYDSNCERGEGSGAAIADVARHERDSLGLDGSRVYLAGFSAGAAFVPNLIVNYPDLYAATAVHSGVEYDAADSSWGASWVMGTGGPDPADQARDAYDRMQANGVVGRTPTVVFQGGDDYTVEPPNGRQAARQAALTCDLVGGDVDVANPDVATGRTNGLDWERRRYTDAGGRVNVEFWSVPDLGHEWVGGASGEFYAEPDGPDASEKVWDFFSRW